MIRQTKILKSLLKTKNNRISLVQGRRLLLTSLTPNPKMTTFLTQLNAYISNHA